ncbi:MAG: TetR/AcrR family transcriptional regulator [Ilumatobacteraceae bacterium]|jgi:AcrR family transcriptional regulator
MSRPPDLEARRQLLDRVIDYLADHGLGEATLRPLANALNTSPTRLMHHFGSKGELLAAALARTEELHRQIEARWVRQSPQITQSDVLRKWWKWMLASRRNLNQVRLGLEAATLNSTVTGLAGDVRAEQIGAWRGMIERRLLARGVPAHDARIEASRLKAAFTGLTLDLVATGDRKRLTEALERILADFERRLELPNRPPAGATKRRGS